MSLPVAELLRLIRPLLRASASVRHISTTSKPAGNFPYASFSQRLAPTVKMLPALASLTKKYGLSTTPAARKAVTVVSVTTTSAMAAARSSQATCSTPVTPPTQAPAHPQHSDTASKVAPAETSSTPAAHPKEWEFTIITTPGATNASTLTTQVSNLINDPNMGVPPTQSQVPGLGIVKEYPRANVCQKWMRTLLPSNNSDLFDAIEKLPGVISVHAVGMFQPCDTTTIPKHIYTDPDTGVEDSYWPHGRLMSRSLEDRATKSNNMFPPTNGAGTFVYVVDDGVDLSHPEFKDKATSVETLMSGPQFTPMTTHGTSVASLICGSKLGVARGAVLIDTPVDRNKKGYFQHSLIRALDSVIKDVIEKRRGGRAVVNLSMSMECKDSPSAAEELEFYLQAMHTANILVVAASGNMGIQACEATPGRFEHVLTVGAIDRHNKESSFSNYGDCVAVFAPGERVCVATADAKLYGNADGTSFATPLITGLALSSMARKPDPIRPSELAALLQDESSKGLVTLYSCHTKLGYYSGKKLKDAQSIGKSPSASV